MNDVYSTKTFMVNAKIYIFYRKKTCKHSHILISENETIKL